MRLFSFLVLLLGALAVAPAGRADDPAARVVVLANRDDPESMRVAQHYVEARGVPAANIVALPMSRAETITWREFVSQIWEPLEAELVRGGWIDAIRMDLVDAVGRTKYAVSDCRISYLVVCRGVPLRIMHDPELYVANAPLTEKNSFRTNAGAVDSELSLLARPEYPVNAFVPNPLFNAEHPAELVSRQVVRVSRLDGPGIEATLALVDHAIAAERRGLLGRAYVDIKGQSPDGDGWLEAAAKQLGQLGFDTDVDRAGTTIPATARCDAPVLYFGWYAGRVNGPFDLPGFQFPPGAIALHIHSYSASTVRDAGTGWVGPFVARGVTATVGNVFEPYLQFTHHPDLLLRALARGATFGDAACYALPALSWEAIAIGDPLYRPFAVSFDEQWNNRAQLPPLLAGYAVLRKINLLDAAGKADEATELARKTQREAPSFAVGMELARRLQAAGKAKEAAAMIGFVPLLKNYPADRWGLTHDAALILAAGGRAKDAENTYKSLFHLDSLPRILRRAWLPDARAAAQQAGDYAQANVWQSELNDLLAAELMEKGKAGP
ncbi:MAG TPA: TIGR03790 family protein [Opitutus sp.]|nr:TIGR03790 family protein [Opitutus sp.]